MKKKLIPFLTVLFFVSGCYIYKPYSELSEAETNSNTDKAVALTRPVPGENPNADGNKTSTPSSRQMNNNQVPDLDQKEAEMKKMAEENMSEDDIKRMKEEQIKKQEMDNQTERQKGSFMTSDGRTADDMRGKKAAPKPKQDIDFEPGTLKSKIQPNKNYKIKVEEKQYKIQVDKWEGDTLFAHILRKPEKELKFHLNQIDEESVMERRFSKPYSDLLTIGSYVAGGAAVLLLFL